MIRCLYIIIGVALMMGCTDGRYDAVLSQIDTLMEAHPDSALLRLDSIRSLKESWPKSLRMRYDLLEAKAQNKAFVDFTSDSIAKEFTRYYDSHGTANERMMAHYLLGCVYRDLGEAPHAVDCYLDAISQTDTTSKDCDFYTLSCAYAQMAYIYYKQLLLTNSIEANKKASIYAFRSNQPKFAITNLVGMASSYILLNKRDSAELILKKANGLYLRYGLLQNALQSSTSLLYLYVDNPSKLKEAKELIDKYEELSTHFDRSLELRGDKRQFYYYKGKYFEENNQLDSAEYYYRKVYRPNMSFVDMDPMYRGLLSVFTKRHQSDSIAKYSQLLCLANDSSIAKKDQDLTAQMAASYNYNRYQKEALENEKIAHHTQIILISILIGVAIVALFLYTIWRNHLKKQEKLRTEYDSATKALENNLQTLQMLDVSYQEVIAVIKEELDKTRNESHTRLMALTAEYEQNKTELEEENKRLSESIKRLEQQKTISDYLKRTSELMNTEAVKHVKDLEQKPLSHLKEKDWDMLYTEIAKYFPNILQDLNSSPKITKQKTRVCLLVSLRIQDNCIANWLDLKPNRVSNIKSELNQELFNETSARTLYNNLRRKYNIIYSTESR
jgi:tetratricopeptide (TPR) repeat protein